jgi:hypothetical protein
MYHHPGAALTFINITKKNTVSVRTIVEQREYFMQLQLQMPDFLRPDLVVPKCLDCDQLVDLVTPMWLWHFQQTQVKLHSERVHELWCIVQESIHLTLLPKWSDGMIDHFVNEKVLSQAPTYKDTEYYQVNIEKGDCLYIPADTLRQWQPVVNAMAVIFQIDSNGFNQREKQLLGCRSLGDDVTLDKIQFTGASEQETVVVPESHLTQRLISYLGDDECLDLTEFQTALSNDPNVKAVKGNLATTGKDLFAVLDLDHDEEFCWVDVDGLTYEGAIQLVKMVNSMLSHSEVTGDVKRDEL